LPINNHGFVLPPPISKDEGLYPTPSAMNVPNGQKRIKTGFSLPEIIRESAHAALHIA